MDLNDFPYVVPDMPYVPPIAVKKLDSDKYPPLLMKDEPDIHPVRLITCYISIIVATLLFLVFLAYNAIS